MTPHPTASLPRDCRGGLAHGAVLGAMVEDLPRCLSNHCVFDAFQLDAGASCCDIEFACSPRVALCRQEIACPLHLRGTLRSGWLALGFVHSGENVRLQTCHEGKSADWFLRQGDRLLVVLAERDEFLKTVADTAVSVPFLDHLRSGRRNSVWTTDPVVARESSAAITAILDEARRGTFDREAPSFEQSVLESILPLLRGVRDIDDGTASSAFLVDRACAAAEALPKRHRIADLCRALRVSPRSLHAAFLAVTGVGPHAYFARRRLNDVRKRLAEGDRARDTVTNVALELGFTELGRFAGKYQALFGEKPSQTLRRRREEKSSSVTMATAQ